MSRGPGRIERAIEQAFTEQPATAFSVEELASHCYPGLNRPEKRHRVAILRSADKVAARLWWQARRSEASGHAVIYHNALNARSIAVGKMRAGYGYSAADAERMADDPSVHRSQWSQIQPGGVWARHAAINAMLRDGKQVEAHSAAEDLKRDILSRQAR